ncbi:MAG: purine and other phosphorylase-like protein, family 1 [Xanthomonadaceae bacterium]|nr:purine and other phosphorylase-like protein, family 1 [Xanthomonadaceae bacterium]
MTQDRVGVVVALLSEAKALGLRNPQPGANEIAGLVVFVSGIGEAAAAMAAHALADGGCSALLSFGTAGALDSALESGDVVCPSTVVYMDSHVIDVDAAWRARLAARCAEAEITLVDGRLLTTRYTLLNAGIKYLARTQSQAVAVDQESSAVGDVAKARGLPFLVVRAIVDDAEATLPDAVVDGVDAYGRPKAVSMIGGLLKAPWEIAKLPGLARSFNAAQAGLRAVARAAPAFAFHLES